MIRNHWNHANVMSSAKENGVSVDNFLAMARKNDPFYIGVARTRNAEWFAEIVENHVPPGKFHVRGVHYLISQQPDLNVIVPGTGKPYVNDKRSWKTIIEASRDARFLGLVSQERIRDMRNRETMRHVEYTFERDLEPHVAVYADVTLDGGISFKPYDFKAAQFYHVEIVSEKSTVEDELVPLCEKYGVNLTIGAGYSGIKAISEQFFERLRESGRPVRILYVSDFDREGQAMFVQYSRLIQFYLRPGDRSVKLQPIILTRDQVENYNLPKAPDTEATELDALMALNPGEFEKIVEDWLSSLIDLERERDLRGIVQDWKDRQEEAVSHISSEYDDRLDEIQAALSEIEEEMGDKIIASMENLEDPPEVPEAEPCAFDEETNWFFDGDRSYLEQNHYYQRAKGDRPNPK